MMLLSVEHVGKTHWVGPYEKPVLIDVALSMRPGDFIGVWGAQRSGKSTLLRIAAGLELPDSGVVRFDDVDLSSLSKRRRGRLRLKEIGLAQGAVAPHSTAFKTVLDYVALPLFRQMTRREARNRALASMRRLGVAECRTASWHQLSDGEKTLVNLASGLVREPRLLLVDDPTAGLDTLQLNEIVGLLRHIAVEEQVAVLMTSRILSAITATHEAFTLSDGRLLPVGEGARVLEFPSGEHQTG